MLIFFIFRMIFIWEAFFGPKLSLDTTWFYRVWFLNFFFFFVLFKTTEIIERSYLVVCGVLLIIKTESLPMSYLSYLLIMTIKKTNTINIKIKKVMINSSYRITFIIDWSHLQWFMIAICVIFIEIAFRFRLDEKEIASFQLDTVLKFAQRKM